MLHQLNDDRLLPGEVLDTVYPEDALHWVAVYTELAHYVAQAEDGLAETLERYQHHLAFWQGQLSELLDGAGQAPARVRPDAAEEA
jgi:hypothetical protein